MVGPGLVTSRGVGRLITTDVGCFITAGGRGCRAAGLIASAPGGVRRLLRLFPLTSRLEMTSAGIRFRTTSVIRTRAGIDMIIVTEIGVRITRVAGGLVVVATAGRLIPDLVREVPVRVVPVPVPVLVVLGSRRRMLVITRRGVVSRVCRVEILGTTISRDGRLMSEPRGE